jgi:pimeloyl-ACP methyl ester carboxylesterase
MHIPDLDFGGSVPELHFAHANGYPPPAYKPLLELLAADYHVRAMITRPLWLDSSPDGLRSWHPLVDDLVRYMDQRDARGWIGVGHSLGAVLTATAALRRPDLFRALVLIDPVFLAPLTQLAWQTAQRLGQAGRLHPLVPGALKRRRVFASRNEMFVRYRKALVFRRIDDNGLNAYVDAMARPLPDGRVALSYSPDWEAKIYETSTINLWSRIGQLKQPLLVIRGSETDTFRPRAVKALLRRLPQAVFREVSGAGHLVPLEKPAQVAGLIRDFLAGQ